jgi:DNA-binding transcriptional regulator YbjK
MRLQPEQRRAMIVTAASRIAREGGLVAVTHGDVAKRCSTATSAATVKHYFPERRLLWLAVIAACPDDEGLQSDGREIGLC